MNSELSIIDMMSDLPDPRKARGKRHKFSDIMVLSLCGALCGMNTWYDIEEFASIREEWFKTFLDLPFGIPSRDTFSRCFQILDTDAFRQSFITWVESLNSEPKGQVIAIDGKSIRRSFDKSKSKKPLHMVNAWGSELGLALGQVVTDEKSNEINANPELLELLNIKGAIITTDAMGCQKKIVKKIIEKEADYCLQLKGNHPKLHQEVTDLFDDECCEKIKNESAFYYEKSESGHGREELRKYYLLQNENIIDRSDWLSLESIIMVESYRQEKGKHRSYQRRYYLTSLNDVNKSAHAIRSHWGVENSLHWVLDVAFREDESRLRTGDSAANMAMLRQATLNLLKLREGKQSYALKRRMCSWSGDIMLMALGLREGNFNTKRNRKRRI